MQFLCHLSLELNQLSHVSYEWESLNSKPFLCSFLYMAYVLTKNVHGKYVGENVVKYFLDNAQLVTRMTFLTLLSIHYNARLVLIFGSNKCYYNIHHGAIKITKNNPRMIM